MLQYFFIMLIILSSSSTNLYCKIISVPKDYKKIQLALDSSMDGDTIIVSKGVYKENIDFYGKKVLLKQNKLSKVWKPKLIQFRIT